MFWKLVSSSEVTFKIQNLNLLTKPNFNPKNEVAHKKTCTLEDLQNKRNPYLLSLNYQIYSIHMKVKKW